MVNVTVQTRGCSQVPYCPPMIGREVPGACVKFDEKFWVTKGVDGHEDCGDGIQRATGELPG